MALWFANKCGGIAIGSQPSAISKEGQKIWRIVGHNSPTIRHERGRAYKHAYEKSNRSYCRLMSAHVVVNFPTGSTETALEISSKKLD